MLMPKKIIKNITSDGIEDFVFQDQIVELTTQPSINSINIDTLSLLNYTDTNIDMSSGSSLDSSANSSAMVAYKSEIVDGFLVQNNHQSSLEIYNPVSITFPRDGEREFSLDEMRGSCSSKNPFKAHDVDGMYAEVMTIFLKGHVDTLNSGETINIYRDGELLGLVKEINADGTWYFSILDNGNDGSSIYEAVLVKLDGSTLSDENNFSNIHDINTTNSEIITFDDIFDISNKESVEHNGKSTIALLPDELFPLFDPLINQIL